MFTWCDKLQRFSGTSFLQRLIGVKFSIRKTILLHTSLVYLDTNILLFVATTISNVFIVYNFVKYVSYFLLFRKHVWLQTNSLWFVLRASIGRWPLYFFCLSPCLFLSLFCLELHVFINIYLLGKKQSSKQKFTRFHACCAWLFDVCGGVIHQLFLYTIKSLIVITQINFIYFVNILS